MDAGTKSLSEVMTSARHFLIPEYQRPYVWTKEDVGQLWDDLYGSYIDRPDDATADAEEPYFLGPIVVANQSDPEGAKIANVVDGQQRTTTLTTLLWVIRHRMGGDARVVREELDRLLTSASGKDFLRVARGDRANYQAIREDTVLDETTPLGVTARYFREKVEALEPAALVKFHRFLLHKTRFVLVQTESFAAAWDLFIGLNGKGRPLTPADLIKAFVCGTADNGEAMADIWESKILRLENDATSALLDIWRAGSGKRGSEAKLFREFERAWQDKRIGDTLLAEGAEVYFRFWLEPIDRHARRHTDVQRGLRSLRQLRRRDITPALIAIGAVHGFEAVFRRELVLALEAYQLWMAITGKRGRERDFAALAEEIYRGRPSEEDAMARVGAVLRSLVPSAEDVREAVKRSAYKGRVMLFILRSYEEGMRGDVRVEEPWYEHIMPQTPTDYWMEAAGTDDHNAYARLVDNIGNITPLDPATNIRGSNAPWPEKRRLFEHEVPNWLAANIARDHPEQWSPREIEARAGQIAEWVVSERWDLHRVLEDLAPQPRADAAG